MAAIRDRQTLISIMKSAGLVGLTLWTIGPVSQSPRAQESSIYPDTAGIEGTYLVSNNTVTVKLRNLTSSPVEQLFISLHSPYPVTLVGCVVDGQAVDSIPTDMEFDLVSTGWYTVRGIVGDFAESVALTYQSPQPIAGYFNWSAGHPFAVFGLGQWGEISCCVGRVGDANGLGGDEPSIGDVSRLIEARFISGMCSGVVACLEEGDVNQSGGLEPTCDDISIGDIAILIDYLFITGPSVGLAECL